MSSGILALLALLAGVAAGFFVGRSSNAGVKRSLQLDEELQQARSDLDRLRSQVIEHFSTTANLVNRLSADYRAIYEHLARGAQQLAGNQAPKFDPLTVVEPQMIAPPVMVDELLEEIDEEEGVSGRPGTIRKQRGEGWYEDVAPGTEVPHYAKGDRYR